MSGLTEEGIKSRAVTALAEVAEIDEIIEQQQARKATLKVEIAGLRGALAVFKQQAIATKHEHEQSQKEAPDAGT